MRDLRERDRDVRRAAGSFSGRMKVLLHYAVEEREAVLVCGVCEGRGGMSVVIIIAATYL